MEMLRMAEPVKAPQATPRLATPQGVAYPWYVRLILALQRRKYGAELESARIWGRLPRAFVMMTLFHRTLDRAGSPIRRGRSMMRALPGCALSSTTRRYSS